MHCCPELTGFQIDLIKTWWSKNNCRIKASQNSCSPLFSSCCLLFLLSSALYITIISNIRYLFLFLRFVPFSPQNPCYKNPPTLDVTFSLPPASTRMVHNALFSPKQCCKQGLQLVPPTLWGKGLWQRAADSWSLSFLLSSSGPWMLNSLLHSCTLLVSRIRSTNLHD